MSTFSELKPCPCGKTPAKLHISEGSTFRWRIISGDCCGEWESEIRVPIPNPPDDYDEYKFCVQDWNDLPRGWLDE